MQAQYPGSLYQRAANDLSYAVAMAPFSKNQIDAYVEQHAPLVQWTWVKEDFLDKLTRISNLMDLVKNPLLLTIFLEALLSVVHVRWIRLCALRRHQRRGTSVAFSSAGFQLLSAS
jgi:hypothetical protein